MPVHTFLRKTNDLRFEKAPNTVSQLFVTKGWGEREALFRRRLTHFPHQVVVELLLMFGLTSLDG